MSKDTEDLLKALSDEFGNLYVKWRLFCPLYESEEIIDLLNESAPTFFSVCQSIFLNDIILAISRLADPLQSGNKENLTLERLVNSINSPSFQPKAELQEALELVKNNCDFARASRNRKVAHTDLRTYFQEHPEPLCSIYKEKIEKALFAICDLLNKVESHLEHSQTEYELLALPDGSNSLIGCLRDAKTYRDEVEQVLRISRVQQPESKP